MRDDATTDLMAHPTTPNPTGHGLFVTSVPTPIGSELRPDRSGFLKLTPTGIAEDFAQDLSTREFAVLTATQVPTSVAAMKGGITIPAWKSKLSWYIIAANDRAISPDLEVAQANRIGATTATVPSSHVIMLAQPSKVADVIFAAASQVTSSIPGRCRWCLSRWIELERFH